MIKKIQLFVYIHFPHSDYFINCPAFISSLPTPPPPLIISSFIQPNKHSIGALWIQRICFPPLKEPLFFDDWAAANFKVINLISDWLAAQQSPYQILRSDPCVSSDGPGRRGRSSSGAKPFYATRYLFFLFPTTDIYIFISIRVLLRRAPGPEERRRCTMAAVAVLRNDALHAFLQVGEAKFSADFLGRSGGPGRCCLDRV